MAVSILSTRMEFRLPSSSRYLLAILSFACGLILYWHTELTPVKNVHPPNRARNTHSNLIFQNRTSNEEIWIERYTNIVGPTTIRKDVSKMTSSFPDELIKLCPSAFDDIPSEFLPEYKNPCYYGRNKFHCLPYFFILGNPKSGTTDIWRKLIEHPAIHHRNKEMHWWTRYGRKSNKTLQDYEDRSFTVFFQQNSEHDVPLSDIITGDASASTFWENLWWEQLYPNFYDSGPPYVRADVIRALLPKSKLIVSLRDPTTRLYSDYLYFRRRTGDKLSPENFHRFALNEIEKYQECNSSRSERACAYSGYAEEKVRIRIGLYSIYMRDWLRAFPRNQLYVIKLEEFSLRCGQILSELYEFLEIAPLPDPQIEELCTTEMVNVNIKRGKTGPMLSLTRERVRSFYRPFVLELASILQDKRFMWDY